MFGSTLGNNNHNNIRIKLENMIGRAYKCTVEAVRDWTEGCNRRA